MIERPGSQNLTPHWVMQMPPSIVPGHGTIFNLQFRDIVLDIVDAALQFPNQPYIRR